MKINITIILLVLVSHLCFTQTVTSLTHAGSFLSQKGDYHLNRLEYHKAAVCYKRAIKKDPDDQYAILRLAETYSYLKEHEVAEKLYREVVTDYTAIDDSYLLKYALVLFSNKKYDESEFWLKKYNNIIEDQLKKVKEVGTKTDLKELYKDSTMFSIKNLRDVNTRESEINPVVYEDKLIFSSTRLTSSEAYQTLFYNIFIADLKSDLEVKNIRKIHKNINTKLHDGPIAVSGNKKNLFLTRNITKGSARSGYRLGIFKTIVPVSGKEKLNIKQISIPDFNFNMGHPAINNDGTIMYFISSTPEGFGGQDLYKTSLVDGKWTFPENLGKLVNTPNDEIFPFFHNDSILFFASNGHGGLGGLDIFKINVNETSPKVENLGYPINSDSDDFCLYLKENGKEGYLASNRPGGEGNDDIYKLRILSFKIKASLIDARSLEIIEKATITVRTGSGEEFILDSSMEGKFEFSIVPGESYKLIIDKENYLEEVAKKGKKTEKYELKPQLLKRAEIPLETGQKYNFVFGADSVDHSQEIKEFVLTRSGSKEFNDSISLLVKQLELDKDELYSVYLEKDTSKYNGEEPSKSSEIIFSADTTNVDIDLLFFIVPVTEENEFAIVSDLDYIKDNFEVDNYNFSMDTIPFFSEIVVDTSSYYDRLRREAEEAAAIKELERLLSMNISAGISNIAPTTIKEITVEEFSFLSNSSYDLRIGILDTTGKFGQTVEMFLSANVKYNFTTKPEVAEDYSDMLDELLEGQQVEKDVKEGTIDISLLSKELHISEGEEFTFDLIPDGENMVSDLDGEKIETSIFTKEETIILKPDEAVVVKVPYTQTMPVNVQTDIEYVNENFEPEDYSFDIDTIPFFSEILVDTTGYSERLRMEEEDDGIIYRVQIEESKKPLSFSALKKTYKGDRNIKMFTDEGIYRYYISETPSHYEAKLILFDCGVPDAIILAYKDGIRIDKENAKINQYMQRMEKDEKEVSDTIINMFTIEFELAKHSINREDRKYLHEIVIEKLKVNENYYVVVNGHTDTRGTESYNNELSRERAESVKKLIIKEGVDPKRITTYAYGESQPLKPCVNDDCDDSVHSVNRRVEIVLLSKSKKTE